MICPPLNGGLFEVIGLPTVGIVEAGEKEIEGDIFLSNNPPKLIVRNFM